MIDDVPLVVGDLVTWRSQSRGVQRQRVGVVAAIVPAGEQPAAHVPPGRWRTMFRGDVTRARTSYLVAIKGEGRGLGLLHHPHTGGLRRFRMIAAMRALDTRDALKRVGDLLVSSGVAMGVPAHRALVPYTPPARLSLPWRLARIAGLWSASAILFYASARSLGWI